MKKTAALLLSLMLVILCACTAGYIEPSEGDQIDPIQESSVSSSNISLYFGYYNEPMLIRCETNVEISPQQQPEYYAISSLITGASGQRSELTSLFGKNTELVEVSDNGEYLNVILNNGFMADTTGANDEETRINRRLAIYSIVNTVCEMGYHSMVQIYVVSDGVAQRPDSYKMGIVKSENEASQLGALSRNTEIVLTPSNVVKTALAHYSKLEWDKLYYYFADKDGATNKLPSKEEFAQKLDYLRLVMKEFSSEDNYSVSENGKNAIVQVSFKIRMEMSNYSVTNVPLELVYKNHCWLISYDSFMRYLEVQT